MNTENVYYLLNNINEKDKNSIDVWVNDLKTSVKNWLERKNISEDTIAITDQADKYEIHFKKFNLRIFCDGCYKLYDSSDNPFGREISYYCYELAFKIFDHENKAISVLNLYITHDGYIVEDVHTRGSICKTDHTQLGMRVFDLLLEKLINGKYFII
ncbi:hypothetical protein ACTV1V_001534 [Cronobacter turicensis]|uniref:hypothetical protein n=1 Tax=Cronobacter sakazakii TaxID=28141 RepID=UPI001375B38A|nr:hypothetical protein [Cronobacter sakazakii]EKM0532374.1 hypothetical protein [Cronobacter turicensis]NCH80357.1 hypothetical protein [Cronobacter sakazakii]HDK7288486.1 hypothetical protein [Cronobacter sakazakii]